MEEEKLQLDEITNDLETEIEINEAEKEIETGKNEDEESSGRKKIKELFPAIRKNIKPIGLIFFVLLAWFAAIQYFAAEKYTASVAVGQEDKQISINQPANFLDYGTLQEGNSSTKFITIENNSGRDVYVKVIKTGDIGKITKADRDSFAVRKGSREKIEFSVEIPLETGKKEYNGKIIILKLPKLF